MMVAHHNTLGKILMLAGLACSVLCLPSAAQAASAKQNSAQVAPPKAPVRALPTDPFGCFEQVTTNHIEACIYEHISAYANDNLHTLSYIKAREHMFQYVDEYQDPTSYERVVKSVYTADVYPVGDAGIPHNGVNAEHSFCQSWLLPWSRFKESRSDLFHIFPVHAGENSRRRNIPFADCTPNGSNDSEQGIRCKVGYEPPDNHKGKLSRAMFYVAVTYNIPLDDSMESLFREWSQEFPPTAAERERSLRVTHVQGNRNPFVDHPEWVELVSDF